MLFNESHADSLSDWLRFDLSIRQDFACPIKGKILQPVGNWKFGLSMKVWSTDKMKFAGP